MSLALGAARSPAIERRPPLADLGTSQRGTATHALRLLAGACALALAACTSTPPLMPATPTTQATLGPPASIDDGLATFEDEQRVRVIVLEHQERWAEAAWTWEVLTVLRPAHAAYKEGAAALQRRIGAAVADLLELGNAAHKRGALDIASAHYLRALALQPDEARAGDALRAIERERNRRFYLGKPSRLTITRRGGVEAMPQRTRPTAKPAAIEEGAKKPDAAAL